MIPFLLGFHPQESVVTVLVRSGRVALTARLDLPPPEAAEAYAEMLQGLARQHGGDELVVLGYSEHAEPAREFLSGLVDRLPPDLVNEALYVDGSRWWSMTCDGPCCPAEGTPYAVDSHPLAAEAVFAGNVGAAPTATRWRHWSAARHRPISPGSRRWPTSCGRSWPGVAARRRPARWRAWSAVQSGIRTDSRSGPGCGWRCSSPMFSCVTWPGR